MDIDYLSCCLFNMCDTVVDYLGIKVQIVTSLFDGENS